MLDFQINQRAEAIGWKQTRIREDATAVSAEFDLPYVDALDIVWTATVSAVVDGADRMQTIHTLALEASGTLPVIKWRFHNASALLGRAIRRAFRA